MTVLLPGNLIITKPEQIKEVMAYPDFEDPMYEKLRDISSELLIPNLHLIPKQHDLIAEDQSEIYRIVYGGFKS
jgi:hypothetical protein